MITVDGYPDVGVLNDRPMKVTVAHGTSYLAIDPGPARIHLDKGETAGRLAGRHRPRHHRADNPDRMVQKIAELITLQLLA